MVLPTFTGAPDGRMRLGKPSTDFTNGPVTSGRSSLRLAMPGWYVSTLMYADQSSSPPRVESSRTNPVSFHACRRTSRPLAVLQ